MSTTARLRRHGRGHLLREDGVALVEFALVLPFLLLIIFGMVDLGKAVAYWNDETHLSNQASRYVAVNSCNACAAVTPATVNNYILTQAETDQLKTGATVTIQFADTTGKFPGDSGYAMPTAGDKNHCVGDAVRVKISYTYPLPLLGGWLHIAQVPINAQSTMRLEKDWGGNGSTGVGSANDKYNVVDATKPGAASQDSC